MPIKEALVTIESIICVYLKPTFLAINYDEDSNAIQIVISCIQFRHMDIQERINYVFKLLSSRCCEIMKEFLVLVSAFDGNEMDKVLGFVLDGDE